MQWHEFNINNNTFWPKMSLKLSYFTKNTMNSHADPDIIGATVLIMKNITSIGPFKSTAQILLSQMFALNQQKIQLVCT